MTKQADDAIIAEIRRRRHAHAESFGFDLKRIVEDLQRRERELGVEIVERRPRKPMPMAKG